VSDAEPGVRVDVVARLAGLGRSSIRSGPVTPIDHANLGASTIRAQEGAGSMPNAKLVTTPFLSAKCLHEISKICVPRRGEVI